MVEIRLFDSGENYLTPLHRQGQTNTTTFHPHRQGQLTEPGKSSFQVSECQASGIYAKRAKQETKKDNAAACLCFLNYLAFLRPKANRAVSCFSGL
jgi:hypothetical protein